MFPATAEPPLLATGSPSWPGAAPSKTASTAAPSPLPLVEGGSDSESDDHEHTTTVLYEQEVDEEEDDVAPADVFFKSDIIDAVAVAAFGGVQLNLDGADQISVHPVVPWMFCIPLICTQFSLTFCCGINIDLDDPIVHFAEDADMEVSLKVLLIIIAQLSFFDSMLSSLRMFLFTINPATWTDIKRIDTQLRRQSGSRCWWTHSAGVLCFFPASAMFLKLCTRYYVNVQAASIILASEDLNDAVFDSLAIAFILDLDEIVWNFAKTILHFDDFDSFVFELWPKKRREQAIQDSCMRPVLGIDMLHRGMGARRLENFLSFIIMFFIYLRLLMNILFALSTNTIPATRDVCLQWTWLTEGSVDNPIQATLFKHLLHFLLWPFRPWWTPEDELSKRAEYVCSEDHYETSQQHWAELAGKWPITTCLTCAVLILMLILPELFFEKGKVRDTWLNWDKPPEEGGMKRRRSHSRRHRLFELVASSGKGTIKRLERLRKDRRDLAAENESLREMVHDLHKRITRAGL